VPVDLLVCVSTEMEGALLRSQLPVLCTGIGAVNAAYALTRRLERDPAKAVIVCGIGGAYPGGGLAIGDVVCAESECYGDLGVETTAGGFLDMQAIGFPLIPGPPPIYNTLPMQIFPAPRRVRFVTVNACTGRDAAAQAMEARTGGAVESMEGAAIAHVAALFKVPVGEIRGISNRTGDRNPGSWRIKEAAAAAQESLLAWYVGQDDFLHAGW
jgi:futalosine hydrolase